MKNAGMMEYNGFGKVLNINCGRSPVIGSSTQNEETDSSVYKQKMLFLQVFDKNDLGDADKLTATLREVLENKKFVKIQEFATQMYRRYRNNAKRISKMLSKKPFSSKDQLIKYVEFAAEFGQ